MLGPRAPHAGVDGATLADCRQLRCDSPRVLFHNEAIGTQRSDSITDLAELSLGFVMERAIFAHSSLLKPD
jgi:hypothetical protein